MKSAFIGLIGRANVGKSTLLNKILEKKVSIVSDKPQTTRNVIRGIYTKKTGEPDDCQLVFLDTPGLMNRQRNKLGTEMMKSSMKTLDEVDIILFIVDGKTADAEMYKEILKQLKRTKTKKYLVINKIDVLEPDKFQKTFETFKQTGLFEKEFGISAKSGKNVDVLMKAIIEQAKEGPQFFPDDMIVDQPERFLAAEIIREKALKYLKEEVPHGIAVEIESYIEEKNITKISAVIYCEKNSHKGIIIGKSGHTIKGIGKSAREDISIFSGTPVYLELFVKVRENWRNDQYAIKELGYKNG